MKIIGLDSSTERLAIGVCEGERIAEYSVDAGRRHSSLLAPHLERVMREMKWRYDQLDYCACGIGPGSFTGLRIGVAAVKGIAFAAGIPVVGISTLDIIAANALSFGTFPRVAVLLDARRQLFYWSIYSLGRRGALSRTQPYKLTSFDEAARAMRGEIAVTGDTLERALTEKSVNAETIREILACLQECDFGRFVSASATPDKVREIMARIRKTIDAVEQV